MSSSTPPAFPSTVLPTPVETPARIAWNQPEIVTLILQHQWRRSLPGSMRINNTAFDVAAGLLYHTENGKSLSCVPWIEKGYLDVWAYMRERGVSEERIMHYQSKVKIPKELDFDGFNDKPSDLQIQILTSLIQQCLDTFPQLQKVDVKFQRAGYMTLFRHSGRWTGMDAIWVDTPVGFHLPLQTTLWSLIRRNLDIPADECPLLRINCHGEIDRWNTLSSPGSMYPHLVELDLDRSFSYATVLAALAGMPALKDLSVEIEVKYDTYGNPNHPLDLDYIGTSCALLESLVVGFYESRQFGISQTDGFNFGSPFALPFFSTIDSLIKLCPNLAQLSIPVTLPRTPYLNCSSPDLCCCYDCFDPSTPRWPSLTRVHITDHPSMEETEPLVAADTARLIQACIPASAEFGLECKHNVEGGEVTGGEQWAKWVVDLRNGVVVEESGDEDGEMDDEEDEDDWDEEQADGEVGSAV